MVLLVCTTSDSDTIKMYVVCYTFNIRLKLSWANINTLPYLVKRFFSLCTYYSVWMSQVADMALNTNLT